MKFHVYTTCILKYTVFNLISNVDRKGVIYSNNISPEMGVISDGEKGHGVASLTPLRGDVQMGRGLILALIHSSQPVCSISVEACAYYSIHLK